MQDNNYTSLINEIEKFSSETNCQSIEEIVSIVDYALRISYSGYLKYENQENMLKLHFDSKERSMVPWAIMIVAYVKKFGNDAQIIYDNSQLKANTIYIKPPTSSRDSRKLNSARCDVLLFILDFEQFLNLSIFYIMRAICCHIANKLFELRISPPTKLYKTSPIFFYP